jgi:hypothetical protein
LIAKVAFPTRELSHDAPYAPIELQSTSINVEFVQVITSPSVHSFVLSAEGTTVELLIGRLGGKLLMDAIFRSVGLATSLQ